MNTETVLFITFAYNDPENAPVEDVSGSLKEARNWMKGRSGYTYRVERQPDGTYGNEVFLETQPRRPVAPAGKAD